MANKKNDSRQMNDCLKHSHGPGESRAGPSENKEDSLGQKRRHSQSSSTETSDLAQKLDPLAESPVSGEGKLKREPECHMQLDKLVAYTNHTVLIDTKVFNFDKNIVPYKTMHVWDSAHVKLPHNYENRWLVTQRALEKLTHKKATVDDVEKAIKAYNKGNKEWAFDCLDEYVKAIPSVENNFSSVISKMASLALKLPDLIQHPIPLLRQKRNHAITMSQEQISCLLANAFFCTFPHRNAQGPGSEYCNFPTINFNSLFTHDCTRKFQKLRALFNYFDTVTKAGNKPNGLVTFERISLDSAQTPEWNKLNQPLTNLQVYPKGFIEIEGKGMLQVDFAAKFIGGGVLGKGLVQEEICFLQCPELIVARLFTEKLADNECLKITGAQMFNKTTGYSDHFKWESAYNDDTKSDEWKRRYCQIVAIDAINFSDPRQQYTETSIKRDLLKAYVGFRVDPNIPVDYAPAIATGNWGCGAFNGDPQLKALLQMMAAAVAQRDLAYFTFGNERQAQELQGMHKFLRSRRVTVCKLYRVLQEYCRNYSPPHHHHHHHHYHHHEKNVFDFIRERLEFPSSL